jgi:hypothetical protein
VYLTRDTITGLDYMAISGPIRSRLLQFTANYRNSLQGTIWKSSLHVIWTSTVLL